MKKILYKGSVRNLIFWYNCHLNHKTSLTIIFFLFFKRKNVFCNSIFSDSRSLLVGHRFPTHNWLELCSRRGRLSTSNILPYDLSMWCEQYYRRLADMWFPKRYDRHVQFSSTSLCFYKFSRLCNNATILFDSSNTEHCIHSI